MKKIFTLFFALVATTALLGHDFEVNGIYYNILNANEVEVTYRGSSYDSYSNEYSGSVTIPETVTYSGATYSVTSIGDYAFWACFGLTSITIPNSVTSIGKEAFWACSALTSVILKANTPPTIGTYLFSSNPACRIPCGSLEAYQSSDWAQYVSGFAENCLLDSTWQIYYTSVDGHIVTPNNVNAFDVNIVSNVYENGQGVITFDGVLTSIGKDAFIWCFSLTSVTIPNSVTSIGDRAFFGCSSLTSVTAPAVFFDIQESNWVSYTKSLTYAEVNAGKLTADAFGFINRSYKTLEVLNLAATTNTTIADEAFKGCYVLDSLYLPSALTYIPYMAVAECLHLQSVSIPASVKWIDERAFENCRKLNEVHFAEDGALTEIGDWAFYNCHNLQDLTIPEGVTQLGDAAFFNCTYLKELTLPASMQSVADNGFALCEKLAKMNVNAVVPPVVDARTFENVDRMIPVVVPTESVSAYKAAPVWQEFNIQGKDNVESDLENIGSDNGYGVMGNGKIIRNGQLIIIRDGVAYNTLGQAL